MPPKKPLIRFPKTLRELDPIRGTKIPFGDLHTRTRQNLHNLEESLGIEWTQAYKFIAPQYHSPNFLVLGRGSGGEDIRYVLRKTGSDQGDQTLLYIDGHRVRMSVLTDHLASVSDIPLPEAARLIAQYERRDFGSGQFGKWISTPMEELPVLDKHRLDQLVEYFDIQWSTPRVKSMERFARLGEGVRHIEVNGTFPSGDKIQYSNEIPTGKVRLHFGGKEHSYYSTVILPQSHQNTLKDLVEELDLLSVSTKGSLLEGYTSISRGPTGERVELITQADQSTLIRVNGQELSTRDYFLLTGARARYSPPSDSSYRSIEDRLEYGRRVQDWEDKQMELRQGQPRRTGGPGFYEKYLKPFEKPGMLYHVTPRENVPDILRQGLTRSMVGGEHYMAPLQYVSENYLTGRGSAPSILEIDTGLLDPGKLSSSGEATTYEGTVPPGAIRELKFIVDYPDPEDRT